MENSTTPSIHLPAQLSTVAPAIDTLYYVILYVSIIFFVGIVGAMLYFMWKYRRHDGNLRGEAPTHANALEVFWTFSPLILLFAMFHEGFQTYMEATVAPDDAINIRVRGRQWAWQFEHPNGMSEDNTLHVPVDRPVRLIMSSEDVIHSFFIPDFRVKRDAVPGMFSTIWFQAVAREPIPEGPADGDHVLYVSQVYCTEYCGAGGAWGDNGGHATMYARVLVQRDEDYRRWLEVGPQPRCNDGSTDCSDEEKGQVLFALKGCTACHAVEPGVSGMAGPNLHGVFGTEQPLTGGQRITADETYVRQSIREPRSQVVEGYQPVMPVIRMSDTELSMLVAYVRSLSPNGAAPAGQ